MPINSIRQTKTESDIICIRTSKTALKTKVFTYKITFVNVVYSYRLFVSRNMRIKLSCIGTEYLILIKIKISYLKKKNLATKR